MANQPPTVVTAAGLQPQDPSAIRASLVADVNATNPGYTANLPGSLIEDVASTDVAAVGIMDSARVETVNSLTPYGSNAFILNQLGQVYGVKPGQTSNTSVNVVFSGPPGYAIAQGFVVSDGTYQYVLTTGGVVASSGRTMPLSAVATVSGTWAVLPNTVTQLVTSVPSVIQQSATPVAVTNPLAGLPGAPGQTEWDFRTQVLQAGLATAQGTSRFLKVLLSNVPGVQARLVSLRQTVGGWEVIVGGGDQFQVAHAIWQAMGADVPNLVGSTMAVTGITNANPGVVTTSLNHGLVVGATVTINGVVGMPQVNGVPLVVVGVIDQTHFSIVNTLTYGVYQSGGVVTPNPRNVVVPVTDYPDVYGIPIVLPPGQTVTLVVTWNTLLPNFTGAQAVAQLGSQPLVDYVNSIPVGAPILTYLLEQTFSAAVAPALAPQYLTKMVFAVNINGVGVAPSTGTGEILGDPESYFFAASTAAISVVQG